MSVRVIVRLDIKGPNVVKGVHLEGFRVLGKPERFAEYYYEAGCDELLYMDAVASLYGRNSLLPLISRTAAEVFVPLCVGGGLRSIDDIRAVLRAGADKVAINTGAFQKPELIREATRTFGSSTIVASIEAIRTDDDTYECFTESGRESTGVSAFEWAERVVEMGAGEILVTSVDQEGTGKGFDMSLVGPIAKASPVPVIAGGGAGQPGDVVDVVHRASADAVAIASLFHYHALEAIGFSDTEYVHEGNIEFMRRGGSFSHIQASSISDVKRAMDDAAISVRLAS